MDELWAEAERYNKTRTLKPGKLEDCVEKTWVVPGYSDGINRENLIRWVGLSQFLVPPWILEWYLLSVWP